METLHTEDPLILDVAKGVDRTVTPFVLNTAYVSSVYHARTKNE